MITLRNGSTPIKFQIPISIPKESSGTAVLKGDVNGNGEVELGDAVAILRYLAKLDVGETFVEKAAYFNDDEVIDLSDAVDILRMLAKIS